MRKTQSTLVSALLVVSPFLSFGASGQLQLARDAQTGVSLTVYSDFAVVRDVRRTTLPVGEIEVEFEDVAKTIDPASVSVRSLGEGSDLEVLRQSYQYDLLNRQSLLENFIGENLKYSLSLEQDGTLEKVFRKGVLLSINPEIVQFGESIEISPVGVITLPYIPEELRTTPTLVWTVDNSRRGAQEIETTYVAGNVRWNADYTLVLDDVERRFDLSSWVNLTNQSGTSFEDATLQLVAGTVQRMSLQPRMSMPMMARADMMEEVVATGNVPVSLADYHLYEFPGEYTIADKESVQLRFRSATGVPITKEYMSAYMIPFHQMPQAQSDRFDVRYTFEASDLGRDPFPAGRVRVMKQDRDGNLQLLGEDNIPHTPVGEDIEVTVGKAFDLGVERTQLEWRRLSNRSSEVTVEVTVTNSKRDSAEVILHETFFGDWEVMSQSLSGEKINSTTLEYRLRLKGGEKNTFTYTVRATY